MLRKKREINDLFKRHLLPEMLIFLAVIALCAAAKNPLIITGDSVKTILKGIKNGKKIYITELTGNPRIKYGGKELKANKIIITGDDGEIIEAHGNIRLIDRKENSRVTAGSAIYYKLRNIVELTGAPRIISRREDDGSRVVVSAEKMEFDIDRDVGFAHKDVLLVNKGTRIHSGEASFDREKQTATFTVNPSIKKNEDIYRAGEITYYTDEKKLTLNNNVNAVTYSKKKDSGTGKLKKIKTVIKGEKLENFDNKEKLTIIYGSESNRARIEREDSVFTGRRIEITGDQGDYVRGENVYINYFTENVEGSGTHFKSDRARGRSALWGDAFLTVRDENSKEETSKIYGNYMEFLEDIDELHIYGNIKIYCDAGLIRGNMAKYKRENEDMQISGNAMIEKEDIVLYSEKIIFNTRTNNTKMTGLIRGQGIENSE